MVRFYKGHKLSVTSLVVSPDDQYVFSGSKDGTIIKCNFNSEIWERFRVNLFNTFPGTIKEFCYHNAITIITWIFSLNFPMLYNGV